MSLIVGYHGCSQPTAALLLAGEPFVQSASSYDWLGRGVYFWEEDPLRALSWATERYESPSLVGAVIESGQCLDLTRQVGLRAVKDAYARFALEQELNGHTLPENRDSNSGTVGDLAVRRLDRAVIDYLNQSIEHLGFTPFETIRALFPEGEPLYPNAGFRELTHVQICVRDPRNVLGVFRLPELERLRLKLPELY